jgi:hypothetical protein
LRHGGARVQPQQKQNHTCFPAILPDHSLVARCGTSLQNFARPGRLMRRGWRYRWRIRTLTNHTAKAFCQCTVRSQISQGIVSKEALPEGADWHLRVDEAMCTSRCPRFAPSPLPSDLPLFSPFATN